MSFLNRQPMSRTSLVGPALPRVLKFLAPAALLTGLAMGLGGCVIGGGANFKETRVSEVASVAGSAVRVTSQNGAVAVRRTQRPDVRISAELRATSAERLKGATIRAERDAQGALVISTDWPEGGPKGGEGVSFDIQLPEASGVTLETTNGQIIISGLTGPARLSTSNGAISVQEHTGDIDATTSNGSLGLRDVTGRIDAQTSNGSADVTLTSASAGPVRVVTTNGNASLSFGAGLTGTIKARTSNGTLTLPAGAEMSSATAGTLKLSEGPESTITASNGSVTVTRR
ncbi:MAG: hypothetical protein SFY95_02990 [Planctomycetota bacterium]|nr:hypothetical protein [Planctomycetota bacterium]